MCAEEFIRIGNVSLRAWRVQARNAFTGLARLVRQLLRREVEDLVRARSGDRYLRERKARTQLAQTNRELRQLRVQLAALEERRAVLLAELAEQADRPA
jgi:hypothetical protein